MNDIRAAGTSDLTARVDDNTVTRLKQGEIKDAETGSVLAIGMQARDGARLRVTQDGNTETDIGSDGALGGPSFSLYRELRRITTLRVIASGGVASVGDIVSLARLGNVSGCVIGKALLDKRLSLTEAMARARTPNSIPERVIPCLDVRNGRVVKGTNFGNMRDSGDPVECADRYEKEGADELVILDDVMEVGGVQNKDAGKAPSSVERGE